MKLAYHSIKDDSRLILTDFNCGPAQDLLKSKDLYKIIWCKEMPITITVDGYQIKLIPNQIVFCTPLNIISLPQKEGLLAIVFNREFYCIQEHDAEVSCNGLLFFGSSAVPVVNLSDTDKKSFESMFFIFQEEFETKDQIQGEMLRVMLKRLLIKSSRLIKEKLPDTQIPVTQLDLVRKYHILVEQNFKTKHKVADYASLLFKSPKTLSNLFNKVGDKSPLKIINERIVLEAKRLLMYSDKSAEEIAYELGYSEPAHFSKFFKTQVGISPGNFKKTKS